MLWNVKYLVCDLDQQLLFISLGFSFEQLPSWYPILFCLEILCGDILLSNNNPQPFNAQKSAALNESSHENTKNTDSSTEK